MCKPLLITTCLFLLATVLYAQKPDYAAIEKIVTNKNHEHSYQKLKAKYLQRDTTITDEEMRLLYYGKFYGKEENGAYSDLQDSIHTYVSKAPLTPAQRSKLISWMEERNKTSAVSLRDIMQLITEYTYVFADNPVVKNPDIDILRRKMAQILKVISSTGDGRSPATALHTNCIADEYAILYLMGYDSKSQALVEGCDYLEFSNSQGKTVGIYFYAIEILKETSRLLGMDD